MRPLRRKGVPLPQFGVRKKLLPRKGKPVQVMRPAVEKPNADKIYPVERKEEKHSPKETKDLFGYPIKKLAEMISKFSEMELNDLLKDPRVTARRMAEEELKKRAH